MIKSRPLIREPAPPHPIFLGENHANGHLKKQKKITQPLQKCINPTIRTGWEILCLPYVGFFIFVMDMSAIKAEQYIEDLELEHLHN